MLVAGGTGTVGSGVTLSLLKQGACVRHEKLSAWFIVIVWRYVVIQGDLLKLESIQPILNSCVVYFCSIQLTCVFLCQLCVCVCVCVCAVSYTHLTLPTRRTV